MSRPARFVSGCVSSGCVALALLIACDRGGEPAGADAVKRSGTEAAKRDDASSSKAGNEPSKPSSDEATPTNPTSPSVAVSDGPVTAQTLLAFLPETLDGAPAQMRQVVGADQARMDAGEQLAVAADRQPTGFVNVSLQLTGDLATQRAQVQGAEDDATIVNDAAHITKRGIAVGDQRALYITFHSGRKTDLVMLIGDRITLRLATERTDTPETMVALAQKLDLPGLTELAKRIPAPPG